MSECRVCGKEAEFLFDICKDCNTTEVLQNTQQDTKKGNNGFIEGCRMVNFFMAEVISVVNGLAFIVACLILVKDVISYHSLAELFVSVTVSLWIIAICFGAALLIDIRNQLVKINKTYSK